MKSKVFLTLCCALAAACSSPKRSATTPPSTKAGAWDYEQVRKARSHEQEQEALRPSNTPDTPQATLDCVIMSETQKARARGAACRKLDPRLGHGENMYCCEKP